MPYLPIDPADLGRSYDAVIRVNSQSGKGGMAYLLEQEYGLKLPRRLQIEFSRAVQQLADDSGQEVDAAAIHALFRREYLDARPGYAYRSHRLTEDETLTVEADLTLDSKAVRVRGSGNGPIAAFVQALDRRIELMDYHEHALGSGADAHAACYLELRIDDGPTLFGVGIDANIVTASFKAVLSALNRQG